MTIVVNRVVIISQQALFREGLRRLLVEFVDIGRITTIPTLNALVLPTTTTPLDLIIFDSSDLPDVTQQEKTITALLNLGIPHVVSLTLTNQEMVIYGRRVIENATLNDLIGLFDYAKK